jgi:CBS domain-containing protein
MLTIHEIMTQRVVTVTPRSTIGDAMGEFDRHDFNALPVVDDAGMLVGIVTKLDVLRALRPAPDVELRSPQAVTSQRVEAIMRRGVVTVEPDDPLVVAADLMVETRLRSLPVVSRMRGLARRLVGMVSQGDLLRGLRLGLVEAQVTAGRAGPAPAEPWS